ncbi:MAG TPA: hypothetical protein VFI22_13105, partial [Thermomicrobiales bacterium]|nr:hypothetical protein [Thermomicrobiales bacterium]
GHAQGVVRVPYEGFDVNSPESEGARRLQVGERVLFFAGYNPAKDRHPVSAGIGVIPIKSDRQADELVATFTPLIRKAEAEAQQRPPKDPCERPNGAPTIAVSPDQASPGDEVRVSGGPFPRPEVAVEWDDPNKLLAAGEVGTDCRMEATVKIPKADSGEHRIVVHDAAGREAEATIEVIGR